MTDAITTTSKWLTGLHAPLPAEVTATELPVRGTLPEALEGRYLRNGPNPLGRQDPATYHWFTGDGMVHGIQLRGGRAEWYRARWVRSTSVSQALGEEPVPGERHGGMETANTNVIGVGGRTFAVVEAGARPVELDHELETICHSDLDGTLPNGFTAHPKVDPATGDLHAIAYHWALPHLQYVVVGPDARVRSVEAIEVPGSPMVHDCSITERWMVVYDLPVVFSMDDAARGVRFPYAWSDDYGARVGVLPLGGSGADVRWFEVEPSYVFHPLNAYEDGDRVVLEVVRWGRMFDRVRTGPDESTPLLHRWTLDLATGRVTEEQLSDVAFEFPRVDERRVGRPHRYAYGTTVGADDGGGVGFAGQLVRHDRVAGTAEVVDLGPGRTSGEWVMVPSDVDAAEDDGWLMSLVHDATTDRSELVVLPAADPGAGPVAAVELPNRVPLGFHGNWVADR
ncbi:carotenoid oxygenase family protein [Actinomarinicola tropica]|uniref:Dioxygenase n=1 Tax=Actinomarinicola tropica TaxID=2789776 RepID=A0A5Q2RIJ0_9ACTN|nr:carotenoid oxygenase family protein [Actinomarinicola tropica]QGG93660.1 carotenoid oxygenase [Actinomarinicola tropica]